MVQRGSTARSLRRPAACEPGQPVMQQAGKKTGDMPRFMVVIGSDQATGRVPSVPR